MIIFGIVLVFLLGISIINFISKNFTILEKIGLSFLVGIGIETVFMFILDIIQIDFNSNLLIIITIFFIIIINIINRPDIIHTAKKLKKQNLNVKKLNLIWIIVFLLICFFLYASATKSLYWPTFAYDNVAGYDLMGKVIASEGRIDNSLFEINNSPISGSAKRCIYPPLVSGSFAFAYLFGLKTSKIISSLFFIFFVISYYVALRLLVNKTNAIIFTFFVVVTPEMYAFSSLSTTNLPSAFFASLSIIYIFLWINKRKTKYLIIGSLLMGLNIWTRTDAIVFNISGFLLILFYSLKEKRWKSLLLYSIISFIPFFAWNIFVKLSFNAAQNVFIKKLFWNPNKFSAIIQWINKLVFNTNLYGIAFYALIISIIINIKYLFKEKNSIILILFFLSLGIYTFLFYQMDNNIMSPLNSMMKNSYRRGLFCFIPIIWFYVSTNSTVKLLFNKYERFLYSK